MSGDLVTGQNGLKLKQVILRMYQNGRHFFFHLYSFYNSVAFDVITKQYYVDIIIIIDVNEIT